MDQHARQLARRPDADPAQLDVLDRRAGRPVAIERLVATMRRWLDHADELRLPYHQADGVERRRLAALHRVYALGAQVIAERVGGERDNHAGTSS